MVSNYLSLFCITFLIFVPWKKGPEWYLKISPKIFLILVYMNYVILPLGNMGLSVFFTVNPKYDLKAIPLESWVVFFTVVCFSRLTEFFSSIKKIVMDDARIYIETRRLKLAGQLEENQLSPLSNLSRFDDKRRQKMALIELKNDEETYMNRKRNYGEGEKRIGKSFELGEDIYSIGFMSQIRDDIMKRFLDITTGKLIIKEEEEEEIAHRLGDANKREEPSLNKQVSLPANTGL